MRTVYVPIKLPKMNKNIKLETTKIYFYIPKQLHLLDLSGVLQVFQEANDLGTNYEFKFISHHVQVQTSAGLIFTAVEPFGQFTPSDKDLIFIPGFNQHQEINTSDFKDFFLWLHEAAKNGVSICSICTGAFLLAKAGLLNNRVCTTHWRYVEQLAKDFPKLEVQQNILFTQDQNIYTSAGIVTGIDLALFLIENRHGAQLAADVAKDLVVYKRRRGSESQDSVYLQNRNHLDERIHLVQDWIVHNLEHPSTIEFLSEMANTSPRNLTRIFKKKTGMTIADYRNKLRVEKARSLLDHSDYKVDYIARLCGYNSPKQLRVLLKEYLGYLPHKLRMS